MVDLIKKQKETEDDLHDMKYSLVGMKNQLQVQKNRVEEAENRLEKVEKDKREAKATLDRVTRLN